MFFPIGSFLCFKMLNMSSLMIQIETVQTETFQNFRILQMNACSAMLTWKDLYENEMIENETTKNEMIKNEFFKFNFVSTIL